MINGKKVLALIPARGGSKGIKDKNIYLVCGKPLIGYSIEAAIGSKYIDTVVVSTDSKKIADYSIKYGADVPFMRPDELASDTAKSIDTVVHALSFFEKNQEQFDIVIFLQATSPLRDSKDIDNSIEFFINNDCRSLLSVSEVDVNPVLIRSITNKGNLIPVIQANSSIRRQDFKKYFRVNGALYINYCKDITAETSLNDNESGYIISRDHGIDIDTMDDIRIVEQILCEQNDEN